MKPRTMKKIFYTLTAAALCLTACQKEIDQNKSVSVTDYPEGATVEALFTVSIPYSDGPLELTRASEMAQIPEIENLYIAIFGDNGGMLQQLVPAFPTGEGSLYNPTTGESGYNYQIQYTAELPLSDEERNLHFIGNCPQDVLQNVDFLYEKEFMDKLSTSGGNAAYWQKVVLPDGIQANLVDGKFVLTPACAAKLTPIALVRNYAKLIVTTTSDDFEIESYALVNVPLQGTIAPYSADFGFATTYMSIGDYCDGTKTGFVGDLMNSGYTGYMTNDLINTDNPGESSAKTPTGTGEGYYDNGLYMYERTKPTRSGEQTGIIIKLKWSTNLPSDHPNYGDAGKSRYYKIEVLDKEGEYMPICRNVLYTINLEHLSGTGETSFDAAYNGPFFGNVSASIETATLTDINDNVHRIVVNRMDYTTMEDGDVVDIYFRFYKTMTGNPELTASSYATPATKAVDGYNSAIASVSPITFDTWNGGTWGHVTVTLKSRPTSGMLREKLRIQGMDGAVGSLFRDIVFTVMNQQEFTAESKVTRAGNNVTVTIGLPSELPYSIFPLNIMIEALDNNLSTTSKLLPVSYGPTAFDETEYSAKNGKNAFYFIRTIQYKDYLDTSSGSYVYTTEFECPFVRTDASDVVVKLNEQGGYFVEKTI